MKKFISIIVIFMTLITGCSGSKSRTLEKITGIKLNDIKTIGTGYDPMSHLDQIQENDVRDFYYKINCRYKIKDQESTKLEVKKEKDNIYGRMHFVIWTTNDEGHMFFYDDNKVTFIYDGVEYISVKSIYSLDSYWN